MVRGEEVPYILLGEGHIRAVTDASGRTQDDALHLADP